MDGRAEGCRRESRKYLYACVDKTCSPVQDDHGFWIDKAATGTVKGITIGSKYVRSGGPGEKRRARDIGRSLGSEGGGGEGYNLDEEPKMPKLQNPRGRETRAQVRYYEKKTNGEIEIIVDRCLGFVLEVPMPSCRSSSNLGSGEFKKGDREDAGRERYITGLSMRKGRQRPKDGPRGRW